MKHIFHLKDFESKASRPLFTGDADSYVIKITLPEEVTGTLTVAAYRPNMVNPTLATSEINGKEATCTLLTGQYDIIGETRFVCTVSSTNGEILTTKLFYADVVEGTTVGNIASDDRTALQSLISLATEQKNECATSAANAKESEEIASQALSDLLSMINTDIATLTDGKLTPSQIPSLSINDVFTVSSAEEMTSLDAQRGDVAVFTYESDSVSTEKPESMVKNTILINQSIDGSETVESLRDEGISFSVNPTSISNSIYKNTWGDLKDGVYWIGSTSPKTSYTNMLSGNYTVNVSTKIDINRIYYYINYVDSSNYYRLSLNYNGDLVVTKKINGITYTLDAVGNAGAVNFHSRACNSEIKVELVSGGGIKISLISADNVASHAKCSYEIIDDGKLYGQSIKEGLFIVAPSYANETSFYSLKIVKHEEYGATIATRLRDTYILSGDDPTNLDSWVKIGISYVEYSGNSAYAENAKNANTINGHRLVEMTEAEFENAVKDPNTYYLVY